MLHQTIKNQISEALRARDQVRLDTLRGLNALFQNEILSSKENSEFLSDDKALSLVRRSVKQHKDSIAQFEAGNRADLVAKEKAELVILESFLPASLSQDQLREIVMRKINELESAGKLDRGSANLAAQIGKLTGIIMKEAAGQADGSLVRAMIEETLKK